MRFPGHENVSIGNRVRVNKALFPWYLNKEMYKSDFFEINMGWNSFYTSSNIYFHPGANYGLKGYIVQNKAHKSLLDKCGKKKQCSS